MTEMRELDFIWIFLFCLIMSLITYRIGLLKGKAIATKMMRGNIKKVLSIGLVLGLASCSAPKPAVMNYLGDVVLIQKCQVCVSYSNINKSDNSKSFGCFSHYEGHSYEVGDKYPDALKHTKGVPVVCGTPSIPLKGDLARITNNK